MNKHTQNRLNTSSLLLVAVSFIAAVIVSNQLFRGWKLDLTENSLYTLSDGTRRIIADIDEPINLYFYFSDKAAGNVPSLRDYANRVREILEEFETLADGSIKLKVIDPIAFSEEEDRATQFGLQGVGIAGGADPIYLGLAGTDSVDNVEVIPFFQLDKGEFLEYDIAKLVSTLAHPDRAVIGLVSALPMTGDFDPQTQQMQRPWVVYQQASQLFEIRNLGTDFASVDDDISLLWVVQPRNLSDQTQYAIDQFVMRGGKALIFVDPLAESDPAPPMQGMPPGMPPQGQGSDLPALFAGWGIGFSVDEVVADARLALQISGTRGGPPIRHFAYLGLTQQQFDNNDVVIADLNSINLGTAGHFTVIADSGIEMEPLLTSSTEAQTMPVARFSFLPDPSALQDGFAATGIEYVLAARVSGKLKSAFPQGLRELSVDSGDGDVQDTAPATEHLAASIEPANLIIVADVDMLGDMMWVQLQNFFGQQIANAFASNGAFVVNALESLSGSSDLIGVRSRASYTRPFSRVEALRVEAESQYRQTEQRLQSELADTEARLGELQSSREDTGSLLMTPEQEAAIDRFIDQRADIRKELRAVQRDLDKNIEKLGTILKILNIGLVPVLITLFALFSVWRRNREQGK
jgi:gliding motility-associatede transport system auxiliary component